MSTFRRIPARCLAILPLVLAACLFLPGCVSMNGDANLAKKLASAPGTNAPAGSPEYQELAKEACRLINESGATMNQAMGNRIKSAELAQYSSVSQSTYQWKGHNARFISPSVMVCESHMKTSYGDDSILYVQFDLKRIANASAVNLSHQENIQRIENESVDRAIINSAAWSVTVGKQGTKACRTHRNPTYTVPADGDTIAWFHDQAKAQRLAVVLNRLSAMAKNQ